MLDETSVKVLKFIVLSSSEKTYRGKISDIAKLTGLSKSDVLRALTTLEQENLIQVSFIEPESIFRNIFEELLNAEALYVEVMEGLRKTSPDDVKKEISRLKSLLLNYINTPELQQLVSTDITTLVEIKSTLVKNISEVFSFYISSVGTDKTIPQEIDLLFLYLDKLKFYIKDKTNISDDEIRIVSSLLTIFMQIPKSRKIIMKKGIQNIYKSIELLEQSLEEINLRILIEGATPELTNLKEQLEKQLNALSQMIETLKEEAEIFYLSKKDCATLINNIVTKRVFFEKILNSLTDSDIYSKEAEVLLSKFVNLFRKEEEILERIANLLPE